MRHILKNQEKVHIEGFVGPAHVSTIIGSEPYETFAKDYSKPVVIAGFEPLDMLQSILMLIRQSTAAKPKSKTNLHAPFALKAI